MAFILLRNFCALLVGIISFQFCKSLTNAQEAVRGHDLAYKTYVCEQYAKEQQKQPAKFQPVFNEIQDLCSNPTSTGDEVHALRNAKLTEDEKMETTLYDVGKERFCSHLLPLENVQTSNGTLIDVESIPEFEQIKNLCRDSTTTIDDIIPTVLLLEKRINV